MCTGTHLNSAPPTPSTPKPVTSLFLVREQRQGASSRLLMSCAHWRLCPCLQLGTAPVIHQRESCLPPLPQGLQKVSVLTRDWLPARIHPGISDLGALNSQAAHLDLAAPMVVLRQGMQWSSLPLEHSSAGSNTVFSGICLLQIQLINFYGISSKGAETTAFISVLLRFVLASVFPVYWNDMRGSTANRASNETCRVGDF